MGMETKGNLQELGVAIANVSLDAILIGNAAATILGAPMATMGVDLLYEMTPTNQEKLLLLAEQVDAKLCQPFPELPSLHSLDYGDADFHVNFLSEAAGINSFASLRSRASTIAIGEASLLVASLADITECERAAGLLDEGSLLSRASDAAELEMIQRRLRLPIHKRTNFLRVRIPGAPNGGTAL
jgi:hypothetical protein